MVFIEFLKKSWTIVHGSDGIFLKIMDYIHFLIDFWKSMDYSSPLWSKSRTIVHGFDQFLKKAWIIVHGSWFWSIFKKIMDYSSRFKVLIDFLKKAWTIWFWLIFEKLCTVVHGFNRFFWKSMDYSSWFWSIFWKNDGL